MIRDAEAPAGGVLHGRRAGRPLRPTQKSRIDRILPVFALDLSSLDDPRRLFPSTVAELRMEIGFGAGEHLAQQSERHPGAGFIGCEPFRNGIAKMLERIEARSLRNVRLYCGDAGLVIDRLPEGALSGIDLLYPDPWPKRRQRKRRFVTDDMLERLARVMRQGAELRFATDIDDYAGWTLVRVLRSGAFAWTAEGAADWRTSWADWSPTRYEVKALREGRRPAYLTFVRR